MWRERTEIHLRPHENNNFQCANFHETLRITRKFLWSHDVSILFKIRYNVKSEAKLELRPKVKYGPHRTDFHETLNYTLCGDLVLRISLKSVKANGKNGQEFNHNVACTAQDVKCNFSNQFFMHQTVYEKLVR
jgi:hypothetical protein